MSEEHGPDQLLPPRRDRRFWRRGSWTRGFWMRGAGQQAGRRGPGRPLTLALGWLLSCVVITGVTLTAVDRVGREVSGSQNLITQGVVRAQVAEQSASAASASSAAPPPSRPVITPTAATVTPKTSPTTTPTVPKPSVKPSPTVSAAATTTTPPPVSPSPTKSLPRPPGIEYVYTCVDGKAVGGQVTATTSPSPTPTQSPVGSASTSPSPSTSSTSSSPSTSSAAPTSSPTPSPSTGKIIETVPGGRIVIACLGDSIANASATTTDSDYTLTPLSLVDPKIDVFFSKN